MAEQARKPSSGGELSKENIHNTMGEEEGVDGEIDEIDEVHSGSTAERRGSIGESPSSKKNMNGKDSKDSRKHATSTRRRHHRHHHTSNHRDRRRRSGGPSDANGEQLLSDEDYRSSARSKHRLDNMSDAVSDYSSPSRFSHRKHDKSRGTYWHGHSSQHRSSQNIDDFSDSGELLESHEDPLPHTRFVSTHKRITKDKKDQPRLPANIASGGEAEDGEILEDGELNDDEVADGKDGEDVRKVSIEVPSSKSSKESSRGEKHNRKKSDHKDRRKQRESDDKTKRKKHTDGEKLEDNNSPAPAWGSGYQGPKPKVSPFHNKQSQYGRGSKGYHSPPGLYDSPSYSEESDEEAVTKGLLTEGYIDSSVAADEKEGIFNPKVSLTKIKKPTLERNDRKRVRTLDSKPEGPSRKKPLVDMAMSDRPACKFYMEGKCAKGSGCQFNHDVEKPQKMEVCKYHLTVKGCIKQRCLYMHEDFPCKYYHTGAKCYSGDRCKFSHDPLTEETRRALEMRVSAEDIVDMEDPDYEYRPRESHSRPSLLGSPPRVRQDVKKIPSLFEIEVHPPGQSPKPPQQNTSRPSGFYNEASVSPKPAGVGLKGTGSVSSPNVGMINNTASMNQQGLSNQGNMGPGLLQTPLRPGNIMGGPMGNTVMMGMNAQQQRLGGGTSIQFLGPGQINSNQQGGNLPPVLNMLGAIIREAAMQKGSGGPNGNMNLGPNSGISPGNILQNMKNLGASISNMQQGNLNMAQNNAGNIMSNSMGNMQPNSSNMGNMQSNNMGNMQSNNSNNMLPLQNVIVSNNSIGNGNHSGLLGNIGSSNMNLSDSLEPAVVDTSGAMGNNNSIGVGKEVGIMDVDYRIKPEFRGMEEANKDLSELDKMRRQIQAQIDKEDEEEQRENDDTAQDSDDDDCKMQITEEIDSVKEDVLHDKEDDKAEVTGETEIENMEIPANLPKKQRELFKRIQQQQLLREKEQKRQEALKAAETDVVKADDDDWYSSDEDGDNEMKSKLTDVLKNLNQNTSSTPSVTSSAAPVILSSITPAPSTASTFNIIQMINAIKSQTSKPTTESGESISSSSSQLKETTFHSSPASPPSVSTSLRNGSSIPILYLPQLTVDPPAVNAHPIKPLVYSVVKISLDIPKPYTQLPSNVNSSDTAFKDDPRVKWHLHHLEKQVQKVPQRRGSSDGEKPQKKTDPRLKKGPADPRLVKPGDSPNSIREDTKVSDPRLQRAQAQSRPADPRLARHIGGVLDPRLSRQNSQNNTDAIFVSGPVSSIGGALLNNMGGVMNNQMGGPMNNIGLMSQGAGLNQMGGSVHNVGSAGSINPMNNQMGGPMNNQMGGPMNNQMGGPMMNQMGGRPLQGNGGPVGNNMIMVGGPMNSIVRPMSQIVSPFNQMGPGANQMARMGGPTGPGGNIVGLGNSNIIGAHMGNIIRGPMNQQSPIGNDMPMLDPRMNSSTGSKLHGVSNDPRAASDPRLKNRLMDPREQRMSTKEPSSVGRDTYPVNVRSPNEDDSRFDDGSHDYRSMPGNVKSQDNFRENSSYLHGESTLFSGPGQLKMSRVREEWAPNSDRNIESNESLPSSSVLSPQIHHSNSDEKRARKFDHRNDPRFKRVKRLADQPNRGRMEYSSPLSGEDVRGDIDDRDDPSFNGYSHSKISTRDPRNRNVSPTLPDTLQDFDLPNSSELSVQDPELDLKVKDLFKTIDPTASPFC